ncbi:MAG TPA: hypothetical protein DCE56_29590 [Cyanobacteria bacterium UBA8553]|nr:hypothetical protein [Cyanobacteria bacterium UBA8553]
MDATKIPAANQSSLNLPHEMVKLLKTISQKEQSPDKPRGGVSYRYEGDFFTGTFTFPIERIETPDGELVKIVNFVE